MGGSEGACGFALRHDSAQMSVSGFLWGARGGVRSNPWDSLFPGSNLPLITPIKLARGWASELGWGGTYNVESRAASFEPF